MLLTERIPARRIRTALDGRTKREVIEQLLNVLVADGLVADRDAALQAILRREQTRSTAIGKGLAVPHAKTDAVGEVVLAGGRTAEALDFDSEDSQGVRIVVLLLSPTSQTELHIQALARLSRVLDNDALRGRLLEADNPEAFHAALRAYELALD